MKEKIRKVCKKYQLTGAVKIVTWDNTAAINIEAGDVIVAGDELLAVECLKILMDTKLNRRSKTNAGVWINKQLRKEGKK
jgi:hypothetical protein